MAESIKYFNESKIIAGGEDCFGEPRGLGVSEILFKVVPENENGIFVIENVFHEKGGPARHLHYDQDEWFYALEGEFNLVIGDSKHILCAGDSILAPKNLPHVWAFTGNQEIGRMLIAFTPAGNMEAFFREVTKENAMPPMDPKLWEAHGMKLMGPPLTLD